MEDILQGYGIKPQGKSAPMATSKTANPVAGNFNFNFTANNPKSSSLNPKSSSLNDTFGANPGRNAFAGDFTPYDDVFGGPPQYRSHSVNQSSGYDDIFQSFPSAPVTSSTGPVFDAPRYDDDIFGGVSGVKSSSTVVYDDVFSVGSTGPGNIEDLLGGLKAAEPGANAKVASPPRNRGSEASATAFDDLLPGFGNSEPAKPRRGTPDTNLQKSTESSQKSANDDPFVVLGADSFSSNGSSTTFHDPLEDFGIPTELTSTKDRKGSSNGTAGINDIFDGFPQAAASSSSPSDNFGNEKNTLKTSRSSSPTQTNDSKETIESKSPKKVSANNLDKNHTTIYSGSTIVGFDSPSGFANSSTDSTSNRNKHSLHEDSTYAGNMNSQDSSPPRNSDTITEIVHDRWITVDEVQLFTQPTSAPPPSRKPPPLVIKQGSSYQKSAQPHKSSGAAFNFDKPAVFSSIDELEEFAMGGNSVYAHQRDEVSSYEEDVDNDSTAAASAAAMKEAMDRAEAKLKMARKVREKEKEAEERAAAESMDEEEKERLARAAQEAREREQREKDEQERIKIEKEREREREREKQRNAVERATREARERAAAEARERAQRAAVERATREARERAATEAKERAAAERVASEARERTERQAAERAAAEARERAAAEAREKAAAERAAVERAAAERAAVERAAAEVRLRAQRAAVERVTAEVRERAAERVSAERTAAKERQMRTDNDLESFFSMGSRANSAPKQRPATVDATFNAQSQSKGFFSEAPHRASGVPSGLKKASSAVNMVDDWASIFTATATATSTDEFQEVEGETAERRRARLERHQRTRERTAKALAEKNERDMQAQRDQAERHRMAETLDAEIKRWAAGKEGNLRALLSTLQYVLWPEAGWQPVSLTDVISPTSVKKVYRKATLCVHPDKVQQKGATIQQKYVAEKVFDLLKEAWNKFNSEELF